ncbi:beta-galactosidase GalA [Flavobacterium polysaccharolyticum]|uniref:Beta-galactosidase GalA n=1 Tax=Flavobacterium polysaccharolyticum TaxID=3133148 RepID=A0ABU9NPZ6_9FLAO
MKKPYYILFLLFFFFIYPALVFPQFTSNIREHITIDQDWRFAFGHPFDTSKDFNTGTGYFSYLAKTTYGDGAAASDFDDRSWRKLDLPHDWAVEQGFSEKASYSHGFKRIGRAFPETSIGWYRKKITIPQSDLGRRIHIAFDGVFRNAIVWFNGHYLGTHPSGYLGFEYDVTDYVNYGGENTIAVRADAMMEEGWFYEGAGIYRHVWLNKTNSLHVPADGTFVSTTKLSNASAQLASKVAVVNEGSKSYQFKIVQTVLDAVGKSIATTTIDNLQLKPMETKEYETNLTIDNPKLWSVDQPYLHKMVTTIYAGNVLTDTQTTIFGIRTVYFDASKGFFLNGKHLKIKGTNNHQDHAGVGVAMPDALQDFRIATLKSFGSNAYRCSHNPPTPELLEACDRLGMLVIDETRLMGIASTQLSELKRMMLRDRNHPSIISWSIANEEWGIEGDIKGARMARTIQDYAKTIDTTRGITAGISGNWDNGIATAVDVIGYNYIKHGGKETTDKHHREFPHLASWGTEEGSTFATRGIYFEDNEKQFKPAYDFPQSPIAHSIEQGWKHYDARDYLAGMFIWTGFDYRGEPTPYQWPATGSYFGMLDQCGFYKDDAWYLKSWWGTEPVLHLLPHWNWKGKEGQLIDVWAYSNCDVVELFLNKKSLGKKTMEKNGHLEWKVKYQAGTLEAIGYKNGKKTLTQTVKTTSDAVALGLQSNVKTIQANGTDIALITVDTKDKSGLFVPTSEDEVAFSISGPAKIIGVGNGKPTATEPDQFLEKITVVPISNLKEKIVNSISEASETVDNLDISNWDNAFKDSRDTIFEKKVKALVYRTDFELPENFKESKITFFYNSIGKSQSIYINGKQIANAIPENKKGDSFILDKATLRSGKNSIVIVAEPLTYKYNWNPVNTNPGTIQLISPAATWKRTLFSGLAQVILQSTGDAGQITLTATSKGLKKAIIQINAIKN